MTRSLRTWMPVLFVAAVTVGTLAWRQRETANLRSQVELERDALRKTTQRVSSIPFTETRVPDDRMLLNAEKLAVLDEDEAALAELRREIAELKARAAARALKKNNTSDGLAKARSITEEMLPAAEWREAGAASPTAALETALWAASVGDVEALAGLLSIDPVVRTQLNALLIRLPDTLRREYNTAERLVALLTAPDVPLGDARIYDFKHVDLRGTALTAVVRDAENRTRVANLTLRQEADQWKLVVPAEAVGRYEAMLKGGKPSATAPQ